MPSFHKRDRATLTWTNEDLTEEGTSHACAICLETLDGNTTPTIACGHVFHTVCRAKLLQSLHPADWLCPVCREQMFVGNAERARLITPVNAAAGEAMADADVVHLPNVLPEEPVLVDASLLSPQFAIFPRGAGRIAQSRTVEYRISEARIFGMPMTIGGLWDQLLHNRTFFLTNRPTSLQLWQVVIFQNGEQGSSGWFLPGLLHPGPRDREIRAGDVFALVPIQSTLGLRSVNDIFPFTVPGFRLWRPWQFLQEQVARGRGGSN